MSFDLHRGLPLVGSFVAGEWRREGEPVADAEPAVPGGAVAWYAPAGEELAAEAVAAAADAAPGWAATPGPERARVLRGAAAILDERAESVGLDLTREEGKALAEGVAEVRRAADVLRFFAGQALEPDGSTHPSAAADTLLLSRRVPVGVVTAITPWNFPIAIPAWKIAPALAFGNAVVWKPADPVPLSAAHLTAALSEAGLPAGALNLVVGRGSIVGRAIVDDDRVDAVTFTGSTAVGEAIRAADGASRRRFQMELGGKNSAVVLADADLEWAAGCLARAAFRASGQKCTATSVVIAERAVAAELAERLAAAADALVVGDPTDPAVEVGPLATAEQAESVRGFLARAAELAAPITRRGQDDVPGGQFVAPAVFAGLPPSAELVREEVFGPVVTVLEADGYEEAVALANATPHRLVSSLFTRDLGAALRFSEDSGAGVVKVNQESTGVELQVPFGGAGASGFGPQEQGKAAVEFFTRWKALYVSRGRD